jgi:hypothetical protein
VLFEGTGNVLQQSGNLFWDNTNSRLGIGTATPTVPLEVNGSSRLGFTRSTDIFVVGGTATTNTANARFWSGGGQAPTAVGLYRSFFADIAWIPSSGSSEWYGLDLRPTINQTGTANGVTRGLYIAPILTAAADWRAIETTVGNVMLNTTSGNTLIGTTTNAGYKLDVSGSARANSIFFGAGLPSVLSVDPTTALANITTAGTSVRIGDNVGSTISGYQSYVTSPGIADRQYTSGEGGVMMLGSTLGFNRTFSPTSGTGIFNILRVSSTINQTGGASGITRGLYIAPTLTAAANFRAIETTAGRIVISDTATVTGTNGTSLLDLSQTWNTTGTPIALKVNITDTASAALSDLISLQVGGSVRFRVLKSGFFTFNTGGEIAGNLTIGGSTIDASSQLEVRSVTKGFLPPRMTTTQKNAIASPASGLVVYDTTLGKLCVRGAAAWETITSV